MSAVDDLLQNNRRHADAFVDEGIPPRPSRQLAVVACMDARIDAYTVLGLRLGEAHVIRNAGGIVTEDVLRSLIVSQHVLGTREVMVIHHTACGMRGTVDDELQSAVERETGSRPPFGFGGFADLDESVRADIRALRDCPYLPHRDAVRGFVYDVATGALREVS
jgi:carbonic anhydrase